MPHVDILFMKHGLRCTRQRKIIFEALASTTSHPTAEELFRQISNNNDLSIATVYNTLELFSEVGLAKRLPGAGTRRSARFDANVNDHVHARCTRTGKVFDLPETISHSIISRIPMNIIRKFEKEKHFKVDEIYIELTGEFQDDDEHRD